MPWGRALRAVLALALPLAIGFAAAEPERGVLLSIGALPVVLADRGGPYRQRAFRLGAAALAATVGYSIGVLTLGTPVLAAAVLVLVATASVLISPAGDNASQAGLLMLVFGVIGSGQYLDNVSTAELFWFFLLGTAWSLVVALAAWVVRGTNPERAAVSQVFVELAVLLSVEDELTSRAARRQLTAAMNTAYDHLLNARARISSRDAAYRDLLTLLSQATPIVEAAVALAATGKRAPNEVVDHVMNVASAVYANAPLPQHPAIEEGPSTSSAVRALYSGLARLGHGGQRTPNRPASAGAWFAEQASSLVPDRTTWRAVLRLSVCVAIAEGLSLVLPLEHAHWIPLTVAIVLKPELGSVFGRAVLRGIGTIAGIGLGACVLLAYPHGWVLVALAIVFAAGVAIGKAMNYALLSASVTPLIIIQMDIQNLGEPELLGQRLAHTLLGCAIVLVFGYWLWPGSLRSNAGSRVAEALGATRYYVDVGLGDARGEIDRLERSRARRRAYRALANVRYALGHVLVEPSAAGRQAIVLWSVTIEAERVVDAVTEVCVHAEQGGECPTDKEVAQLSHALDELAGAVRHGREPDRAPLPGTDLLTEITARVDALFDILAGFKADN